MKKILLILGVLVVGAVPANAEILKVQALSEFNTENPPSSIEVKAVSDMDLNEELLIMDGFILKGNLVDVVSPKRLKRDATFSFVLTEYIDNNGKKHVIDQNGRQYKGKFTTQFNYKHAAKSAALSVGNFFLQGLSIGYAAVEGAVKNEEGNRVKSSAMSVYESTPISYVEKGTDIVILKDQVFCLKFKLKDEKEKDSEDKVSAESEKLPDNAEVQLQQENTAFQDKTTEELEPEPISQEEKERRMNLKAPLPGEEYGVTIEDLQAEVLNKPVRQENVAFKFGRSDSKNEEQKEKSNLKSPENLNELSQPAQTTKTPEQTEQLEEKIEQQPASTDAEPVLENEKSAPAESAPLDNTPNLEDEKTEEAPSGREFSNYQEFKPQSKTLKLRKNPKTDRLQPVEDIRPVKSEEIKTPLQEESSKPQALENKEEVQTILTEPKEEQQTEVPVNDTVQTVQQQAVPQESETINNSVQQSELNPQETVEQTDTEKYTIPTNTFNQSTAADETLKNNNDVASKPLKRHDADSFDNLVPEIPAPSEIPLAPLDLPDTY